MKKQVPRCFFLRRLVQIAADGTRVQRTVTRREFSFSQLKNGYAEKKALIMDESSSILESAFDNSYSSLLT